MLLNYFPELDYYFTLYWLENRDVTIYNVLIPEIEDKIKISNDTFFKLLFSDEFEEEDYEYKFNEARLTSFTKAFRERIRITSGRASYFYMSETEFDRSVDKYGDDLFGVEDSDLKPALDALLAFRKGKTVDLNLYFPVFEDIDNRLAKLIYLYLNFMINNEYQGILNENLEDENGYCLDNLFYLYVINEAHKNIKNWSFMTDNEVINTRPVRLRFVVDSEIIYNEGIIIDNPLPYNMEKFSVYKNGRLLIPEYEYKVITEENHIEITWDQSTLDINENDIFIVLFNVLVEGYFGIEGGEFMFYDFQKGQWVSPNISLSTYLTELSDVESKDVMDASLLIYDKDKEIWKTKPISMILDGGIIDTSIIRKEYLADSEIINNKEIEFSDPLLYDGYIDYQYYINGKLVPKYKYTVELLEDTFKINWSDLSINIDDQLLIDVFVPEEES
ncbi:MAG: hypothetical protein ACOCQD_00415 [archaeon]